MLCFMNLLRKSTKYQLGGSSTWESVLVHSRYPFSLHACMCTQTQTLSCPDARNIRAPCACTIQLAIGLYYSWIGTLRPEGIAIILGDVIVQFLIQDLFRKSQGKPHTGLHSESKKAVKPSRCVFLKSPLEVVLGRE